MPGRARSERKRWWASSPPFPRGSEGSGLWSGLAERSSRKLLARSPADARPAPAVYSRLASPNHEPRATSLLLLGVIPHHLFVSSHWTLDAPTMTLHELWQLGSAHVRKAGEILAHRVGQRPPAHCLPFGRIPLLGLPPLAPCRKPLQRSGATPVRNAVPFPRFPSCLVQLSKAVSGWRTGTMLGPTSRMRRSARSCHSE